MKILRVLKSLVPVILPLAFMLLTCKGKQPETGDPKLTSVIMSEVRDTFISVPVHSNGILVTAEELKLSFKTGGIVAKLNVEEGGRVKKGELLAALDLSEIRAAAEQAELGYKKALRDYERASNLFRDSVATLEHKQDAGTALELAKSRLRAARFNLNHSEIKAPSDGIVLKKLARVNEIVGPGYPVIFFGSSDKLWRVKASLSDKDLVKINPGDTALITFDAYPGITFSARVEQTGEIANPMTGTYEVEMTLEETGYRLASGFIAGVELYPSSSMPARLIPFEAVVDADGERGCVYFLEDDGSIARVEIFLDYIIGNYVAVRGLPDEVRTVVSGGAPYIGEGEKVKVIRTADR